MLDGRWPDDRRTGSRVVVECQDRARSSAAAAALVAAGHDVQECIGPDDGHLCPLLARGSCPLIDGADVVVNLLGFGDEDRNRVLPRLRSGYPCTPIAAEASTAQRFTYRSMLRGVFPIDPHSHPESLLDPVAVAEVCSRQQAAVGPPS